MKDILINGRWTLTLPDHRENLDWDRWEIERLNSMYEHLSPGDVIFDIGAEEGDLPALWASWGCSVVCFEPGARIWPNIKAVWDANDIPPMLGWYMGFASDVTEENPKNLDVTERGERDGWPAVAFGDLIVESDFRHLAQQASESLQITIDDYVKRTGIVPDALTIDVEGSEFRVLKGARETLLNNEVKVWISVHIDRPWIDSLYGGFTSVDVCKYMGSLGYQSEFLVTDHEEHWRFWK